jgi:hypothetical protein
LSTKFHLPYPFYYLYATISSNFGIISRKKLLSCFPSSLPFFVTFSGEPNTPKPWRSPWLNYRTTSSGTSSAAEGGGGRGGRGGGLGGEGPQWIIDNPAQFSGRIPSWVSRGREGGRERERERERGVCVLVWESLLQNYSFLVSTFI